MSECRYSVEMANRYGYPWPCKPEDMIGAPTAPAPDMLVDTYKGIQIYRRASDGQLYVKGISGTFGDLGFLHNLIDADPVSFGLQPTSKGQTMYTQPIGPGLPGSPGPLWIPQTPVGTPITVPTGCDPKYQDCIKPGQLPSVDEAKATIAASDAEIAAAKARGDKFGCPAGQVVYDAGILGKTCIPDVAGAFGKISGYIIPAIIILVIIVVLGLIKK